MNDYLIPTHTCTCTCTCTCMCNYKGRRQDNAKEM